MTGKKLPAILFLLILLACIPAASALTWTYANGCWTATDGTYGYVKWNATGPKSWQVPAGASSVDGFVLAGGGGGANLISGGGGAGGYYSFINYLVNGTIQIVVGAGGLGKTDTSIYGEDGGFSLFGSMNMTGGGGGGYLLKPGRNGGSGGGGGGRQALNKGLGTTGQGYDGGDGNYGDDTTGGAGGGGGASGVGSTPTGPEPGTGDNGGNGGPGVTNNLTGENLPLACGGGGGYDTGSSTYGNGGCSVAGHGGPAATSGQPNSGSGGGGGSYTGATGGGNGGSGLIIIRYLLTDTSPPASITNLAANTTAACQNITWTWTNPTDSDYSHLMVWENNVALTNQTNGTTSLLRSGLLAATNYTLSTKTVDLVGNVNATFVNLTATTTTCPTPTPTPTPTVTVTPAPPTPGAQWCGLQDIFFQHDGSDIAGYENWINFPSGNPEVDENVTLTNESWNLVDSYITPQNLPNVNLIQAGLRTYYLYAYASTAAGTNTINVTLFKRNTSGFETKLYSVESGDVDASTVTLYTVPYASSVNLTLDATDRLVAKVYVKKTTAGNVQFHWIYQGTAHASYVRSGYFVCAAPSTPTPTPSPTFLPSSSDTNITCDPSFYSILWNVSGYMPATAVYFDGDKITNYYDNSNQIVQSNLLPGENHLLSVTFNGTVYSKSCSTKSSNLTRQQENQSDFLGSLNDWIYLIIIIPLMLFGIATKNRFFAMVSLFLAGFVALFASASFILANKAGILDIWHLPFLIYGILFLLAIGLWAGGKRR